MTNGHNGVEKNNTEQVDQTLLKRGLAQMLKGGVIMDVVTPEHAKIAEDAGACAVMALERVPADIRANGGVARGGRVPASLRDRLRSACRRAA